ncbi:MAG: hypothetical protein GC208_00350 [Alphaproteobacteria bacterium]|nr:hypothetical protein [Alphaproteobacteria bacterium]
MIRVSLVRRCDANVVAPRAPRDLDFPIDNRSTAADHSEMMRMLAISLLVVTISPLSARADDEPDCYDAEVSAEIIAQVPTVIPDCDDCLIMRWPWFLDLDVVRTHSGEIDLGPLTVLSVQHTYFREDRGAIRWKLRRNTLAGYNAVGAFGYGPEEQCQPGTPPARPHFDPGDRRTLDDVRREGEERYGRNR